MDAVPANTGVAYQYSPLPSARHIRLLRIHPRASGSTPSPFYNDDDPIKVAVDVVCLDDNPTYDALSYTWGNPMTVYQTEDEAKESQKLFDKPCEVFCDDASLAVTRNLYDALLAIRGIPNQNSYKRAFGCDRADLIWIDALCIHQQDTAERNAQVKIMDQIYAMAQMTIVWLGRDDIFTRPAAKTVALMHDLPLEEAEGMRADSFIIDSRDVDKVGLSGLNKADWLALYAFLNRSWFMRVW